MKKILLVLIIGAFSIVMFAQNIYAKDATKSTMFITKADYLVLLHKALDININYFAAPDIEKVFSDVKNSDAYACDIYDLVTTSIVDDKGKLNPNKKITRQEAVHYLVRAYGYSINDIETTSIRYTKTHSPAYRYIKDLNKVNIKFRADVMKAYTAGLIESKGKTMFSPRALLKNREANTFANTLKNIMISNDKGELSLIPSYSFLKDSFEMVAELRNDSKKDITINFNSGQKYNFVLLDESNKELYNWSQGRMFTQSLGSLTLKPGERKLFRESISPIMSSVQYDQVMAKAKYLKVEVKGTLADGTDIEAKTVEIIKH